MPRGQWTGAFVRFPVIDNAVAIIIAEWARFTNNKAHLSYKSAEYVQRSKLILTIDIPLIIRDSSLPSADLHQTEIQNIGQINKPTTDKPVGGGAGKEKRKTQQQVDRSVKSKHANPFPLQPWINPGAVRTVTSPAVLLTFTLNSRRLGIHALLILAPDVTVRLPSL